MSKDKTRMLTCNKCGYEKSHYEFSKANTTRGRQYWFNKFSTLS